MFNDVLHQFFIAQIASFTLSLSFLDCSFPPNDIPYNLCESYILSRLRNMMDCHSTMKRYQLKINSYQRPTATTNDPDYTTLSCNVTQHRYQLHRIDRPLARIDYFRFEKLFAIIELSDISSNSHPSHSVEYVIIVYGKSSEGTRWLAYLL